MAPKCLLKASANSRIMDTGPDSDSIQTGVCFLVFGEEDYQYLANGFLVDDRGLFLDENLLGLPEP